MKPETANAMSCPMQTGNADVLLSYCARLLDEDRTALIESHLEVCPECHAWAADQKLVWSAMDAWEPEPISANFDQTLFAKIAAAEKPSLWEAWSQPVKNWLAGEIRWKPALSVCAVCLTVVVGIYLQNPWSPTASAPALKVESRDIEQAEKALEDMEMLRQFDAATAAAEEDKRL